MKLPSNLSSRLGLGLLCLALIVALAYVVMRSGPLAPTHVTVTQAAVGSLSPSLVAPLGPDGFLLRGWVAPTGPFLLWTFVQAAGSLLGVGLMIRAYQLTDASRASVLEYIILPASAFWTWVLWGKGLEPMAVVGMALIVAAGTMIALRARQTEGA